MNTVGYMVRNPQEILATSGLPEKYPSDCSQQIGQVRDIVRRMQVEKEPPESSDLKRDIEQVFSKCGASATRLAWYIRQCVGPEYYHLLEA